MGQLLERALGNVAVNDQANHAGAVVHLPEFGTLRRAGKRLDEADRGLDFVHGLADIRVGLQLDPHGCHPRAATGLTALISSSDSTCSSILTMIDSSTSSGVAPG